MTYLLKTASLQAHQGRAASCRSLVNRLENHYMPNTGDIVETVRQTLEFA